MLLIICQSKKTARSVADTFHYMSILAYGTTPHEALSEVSNLYRAVLIIHPESFPNINDYVGRIKSYKRDIPVFALTDTDPAPVYADIFEGVFTKPSLTPSLASKIINFANKNNRAKIGDYRLGGFDASSNLVGVTYFDRAVNLTKTEAMILRYLLRSYPIPQSAKKIIKYAFKSSRAPELSGVRTHICGMNKKFVSCLGKKMVVLAPRKGYLILTPEYEKIVSQR